MSTSESFAFVPRKVAKCSKVSTNASTGKVVANPRPPTRDTALDSRLEAKGKAKAVEKAAGKSICSDEDYAVLVALSLSDHALWSDPDLRRTLDWSSQPDVGTEGFIPLSQLLRRSPVLSGFGLAESEASVARALRAYASDELDVRMLISDPSKSSWSKGKQPVAADALGGYEIRRKDCVDASAHPSRDFSKNDWEKRTFYLEGIPTHYRTIPGIARFTLSLLARDSDTAKLRSRIQNITLPPHHQDGPDDQPKCKGMALVTLARTEDLQTLLHEWPWDRKRIPIDNDESTAEVQEAVKFGFRTLSKVRWDQLNEEYLAYRRDILDEITRSEDIPAQVPSSSGAAQERGPARDSAPDPNPKVTVPQTDLSSPYPLGCLVFVRNIHTESNKTTLRTFFTTAFKTPAAKTQVQGDGLDYIDFNKGTDSCHLRLATPLHSQILVDHFTEHLTTQDRGLDDVGIALHSEKSTAAITMEIVQGKKEALYWEKVPEKVRRQAVEKAIGHVPSDVGQEKRDVGARKRNKRTRND